MRDYYTLSISKVKSLLVAGLAMFAVASNAQPADLSGVYTLEANGSVNSTGALQKESTIRIYKAKNALGEEKYYLYGWMGKSNNVEATYDATTGKLSVAAGSYVYGAYASTGMPTMMFMGGVGSDNTASQDAYTFNVANDGSISFDSTLGFFNYSFFGATLIDGITSGKLTKQADAATLTDADLTGAYTFKASSTEVSDNENRLNSKIKADGWTLNVTAAGNNTYKVSGLFGISDLSVTMTYYPQIGLLTTDEMNSGLSKSISVATDGEKEWTSACMFSNLNFVVAKAADGTVTLTTLSEPFVNVTGNDDSDDDGNAYYVKGGVATKGSSAGIAAIGVKRNAQVEVYTLDGRKAGNSLKGLPHGMYIVKEGNHASKKVVL